MATAYPTALDATDNQLRTDIGPTDDLDASGKEHDEQHVNVNGAVVAVETKLGTGASTATSGAVMMGTGSGTSAWDTSPTITGLVTCSAGLVAPLQINSQSGTTYTFADGDQGKLVIANNGSAQTYTVPPNSSEAFATGTTITVIGIGAGKVTLAEGSGVTINSKDSEKAIDGQHASVTLIKTATDTWQLIGALQA